MKIVHTGPDGSTLTMDIPESLLVVFKETHTEGEIETTLRSIGHRFYSTVILALINDGKLLAEEGSSAGGEEDGLKTILGRFDACIAAFAKAEIPSMGDTSKQH